MKYIIGILLLLSFQVHAEEFWEQQDKQKHMALSALAANTLRANGATEIEAFVTVLIIGLSKEMWLDNNSFEESGRDMLANTIGASTVFMWKIEF